MIGLALLLLGVLGCQVDPYPAPIEGTTYRISKDVPGEQSEVTIDILTTRDECVNAKVNDVERCIPFVDRAAGEVRLAFELRDPTTSETLFRALDAPQVRLQHDSRNARGESFGANAPIRGGVAFTLYI